MEGGTETGQGAGGNRQDLGAVERFERAANAGAGPIVRSAGGGPESRPPSSGALRSVSVQLRLQQRVVCSVHEYQ